MSISVFKLRSSAVTYNSNNEREYTLEGYVEATEDEDEYSIYKSASIPQIGDKHPSDAGASVVSINASWDRPDTYHSPDGDTVQPYRKMWKITINYKNVFVIWGDNDLNGRSKYPWELGAYNVNSDTIPYQKQATGLYDEDGTKLPYKTATNTVGDILYLETTKNNILLRFNYDSRDFDPAWYNDYVGSVNKEDATIAGYIVPAGWGKIRKIQSTTSVYDDGTIYYKLAVELEIENEVPVRYKEVLNAGFNLITYTDPSTTARIDPIYLTKVEGTSGGEYKAYSTLTTAEQATAEKITEVVPISEDGKNIAKGDVGVNKIYYLKFYDTWLAGWRTLGFPDKAEERSSN